MGLEIGGFRERPDWPEDGNHQLRTRTWFIFDRDAAHQDLLHRCTDLTCSAFDYMERVVADPEMRFSPNRSATARGRSGPHRPAPAHSCAANASQPPCDRIATPLYFC